MAKLKPDEGYNEWSPEEEAMLEERLRKARRNAQVLNEVLALPQLLRLENLITDVSISVDEAKPGVGVQFLPSPMVYRHDGQRYEVRVYVSLHPCMARMILSMCNGQRLATLSFDPMHEREREGLAYLVAENADRSARPRVQILNYAKELEWLEDRVEAEWNAYVAEHLTTVSE